MVSLHSTHVEASPPEVPGPATSARSRTIAGFSAASNGSTSATCSTCHQEIGREWSASMHHGSWTDPVFQKAYAIEPKAFCRGCHAPESDPIAPPSRAAQDEGITCLSCHATGGSIAGHKSVTAPLSSPTAIPSGSAPAVSPHPVSAAPWLSTAQACEGCHQFNFPKDANQLVPSPMQNTHNEWRSSSFANTACQSCHMPLVDDGNGTTHHNHDFSVIKNPSLIRRAVRVSATRPTNSTLEARLESAWVGHAFPTGDMFRRLQFRVYAVDATGGKTKLLARPIDLARTFRDVPLHPDSNVDFSTQRVEGHDHRLGPPGTSHDHRDLHVDLREAEALARVQWELVYQRMMTPLAESFGINQVEDELVLASGTLESASPPSTSASAAPNLTPTPSR
ncbi:MAG: multiheme c-type cytochrome [Polyangiaceae bacterium]